MGVATILGRLLNIRSFEWRRLLILYAMSFVVLTAMNWVDAIVQAAFLQQVGVQYLPWVIVLCATCSIGALFIYAAFADQVSNTGILIALMGIGGTGIVVGLAALAAGIVGPAYLILYLVLQVPLLDVYNVHWGAYVNGFYDIRTAKRIVPVLSTSARLAGIIGGLTMPLLNRLLSPPVIIALGIVALAFMALLAAIMPRLLHQQVGGGAGRAVPRVAVGQEPGTGVQNRARTGCYRANLREGYQHIQGSPFLRWMALSTLCMTVLMVLLTYSTSAILQAQLKTTVAISNFTGILTGVANLVVLPFQLFVLSRLITRVGLGNASLIYPLASLVSAGALAALPGLSTAALGYLDRTAFRTAFRIPIDNLLYNAVPQRIKTRTRAFVGGLVVPIGAIVSGLLLLTPLVRTSWFLPTGLLVVGVALAIVGFMVRKHYSKALLDLLEQEDYSSLALQAPSEQEPSALSSDPATLAGVARKLSDSLEELANPERTVFLAQLMLAAGGEAAVPLIGQAARQTPNSRLRASLLDVLATADVRGTSARELYRELLSDPDPQVRLSAVTGLEQIEGRQVGHYLEVANRLLADPEIDVRLRVLPALLASDNPSWHAGANAELRALLKSPDPRTRTRAVRIVGQARAFGFMLELVRALTDPEDVVRLAAGLATEELAGDASLAGKRDMLLALALLLIHDPVERARVSAVTVLDRLSEGSGASASAARESAVAGLADPSRDVRQRTVETLVRAGRRMIPQVHEHLNAADPHQQKMAAVVLARIDPRRYGALVVGASLNDNLLTVYRNLACLEALVGTPGPTVDLLSSALRERNALLIEEAFYLLTAVQEPAVVQTLERSLRSPQPEVRANAAEALESLTAPQTAALLGPLLEPDRPEGPSLALARQIWDISLTTPVAALRLLLGDASDTWQRILAAAALAELSASDVPQPQTEFRKLLELARADPDESVRAEAGATAGSRNDGTLSLVRKIVTLKVLPFFCGMLTEQLRVLAGVCEEEAFPADTHLFSQGDPGGILYAVVMGRVSIEQEKRKGSIARIATVEAGSYLGESEFFDGDCRTNSAVAIQDTLTLKLRREPLIALARRQPELSLDLIKTLSDRLREANERIAELTRTEPETLQKLYDQFELDV